jgi:hypothetical protein
MKALKIVRLMVGAGALVLAAASGASAQEEGVAMKSILGSMGIIPKDRPNIEYRERAPLVLPPKMELRAPADRAAVESRAANWPKDPDVIAARKEAAEARTPWTSTELYKNSEGKRLSIEEMRAGRRPGANAPADPATQGNRADKSRMEPDELRSYTQAAPKLSGNLERRTLSDPPQALLNAASNAPLKASQDPVRMEDPDSPGAFIRQQRARY